MCHGFTIGSVGHGFASGPPEVRIRLVPHFCVTGVLRQPVNLLCQAVVGVLLKSLYNAPMYGPALFVQQIVIGYFVRQRMLEGAGRGRQTLGLVEKFAYLQRPKEPIQGVFRYLCNGTQKRHRDLGAYDSRYL